IPHLPRALERDAAPASTGNRRTGRKRSTRGRFLWRRCGKLTMGIMLANAERLAMEAMAAAFEPPPPIDYLAWAERNVIIEEGSVPGPFQPALFPFFGGILGGVLAGCSLRFVRLVGLGQVWQTTVGNLFT